MNLESSHDEAVRGRRDVPRPQPVLRFLMVLGFRGSARRTYMSDVVLTDGGVSDNLGLETAWKRYQTIFVSNGGGKMQPEEEPKGDWARHALRINDIIDNQVRSLKTLWISISSKWRRLSESRHATSLI